MTAVAIMMLADEGRLSVHDPVEKYLPEFAGQRCIVKKEEEEWLLRKPSRPATIADLLLHTSGFPFKTLVEEPTLDLLPLAMAVRSYAMSPLDFEPGTSFQYSNAGFNTAGRIVEVITGKFFEQFLDERLFHPLGMEDTTFWPDAGQEERRAQSYRADTADGRLVKTRIDQLYHPLTDIAKRFPVPGGGLFSTAGDLARFYRMMLNGGTLDGRKYLSAEAVRELTRRHTPESWEQARGYGFVADGKWFGHGGAYGTHTMADPENGLILGWLVQQASFFGEGEKARGTFEKAAVERFGKG
jgi:CubicO group peptidase (beta-lactamase class C family)